MSPEIGIAVAVLAFVAAMIQAISGFGFSLFIVPILAFLLGPRDTVVLANLLSTFSNVMQTTRLFPSAEKRTAVTLMAAAAAGMPIGLAVLLLVDPQPLQVGIALAVIISTILLMRGVALHAAGTTGDVVAGFTSGVLNTSTSMSGPPVVLYLQGKGMPPLQFRATTSLYFLVTSGTAVVLVAFAGVIKPHILAAWAIAAPSVVVGQMAGNRVFRYIDPIVFRRIVFGILFLSAGVALAGAVAG